jgi:hypothetical protein
MGGRGCRWRDKLRLSLKSARKQILESGVSEQIRSALQTNIPNAFPIGEFENLKTAIKGG